MNITLDIMIDNFTKKLLLNSNDIKEIDILLSDLINYCIKKKILYYIENNISYTQINNLFKKSLCIYLNNLIDPNNNLLNDYIITNNLSIDNLLDLNSLLFKKCKENTKNQKVSFNKHINVINYSIDEKSKDSNNDESIDNNDEESKDNSDEKSDNNSDEESKDNNEEKLVDDEKLLNKCDDEKKYNSRLLLYIKILVDQDRNIIEFIEKLTNMCYIISNNSSISNI